MDDLISRQATIVVIECSGLDDDSKDTVVRVLEQLPSAQPKTQLSTEDATFDTTFDCISRQAAIDTIMSDKIDDNALNILIALGEGNQAKTFNEACDRHAQLLNDLPSARPDTDEWCTDCKEYDHDRHCCPRWNRVIRETLKDAQQWIPCSERLPEEKDAGILKKLGTEKRSEYVLATVEVKGERMTVTACTYDGKWDWNMKYAFPDFKVVAWMPLPRPYQEGEQDERDS